MYVEHNEHEELKDVGIAVASLPNQPYIINDILFDGVVSLHIESCDIFHGWSGHSLFTMKEVPDAVKIVNLFSVHINEQAKILNPEAKKLYGEKTRPVVIEDNILKVEKELEIADIIHVPSEFIYRSLKKYNLHKKAIINPFGVDVDKFKPVNKKDDKFRVIFVGSNWLRKGLIYLLKAWEELNFKNAELIVAGVKEPIIDIDNVTWGWYNHDELVEKYNSSNLFILPSLEDGCPLVTYEAMACKLPVAITTNTGTSQMIRHGHNGFVLPVRDVDAIMDVIQKIYDEPDYGEFIGNNARKTVEGYTWKKYEDRYMKIIKEI